MKNVVIVYLLLVSSSLFSQSSCIEFDGVNNYISTSSSALDDIDNGDFTIMARVKGLDEDQPTHPMIISNRETEGPGCLFFFHDNFEGSQNKLLTLQLDNYNYFVQTDEADVNFLDGEYHHVVVTKGDGLIQYYGDGILIGTRFVQQDPTAQTFHEIWIGQDDPTNNTFDGNLSGISIWDKALSPEEINLYSCDDELVNAEGLVAFWPLDEGAGQEVIDQSNGEVGLFGGSPVAQLVDPIWVENCSISFCTVEICNDGIDNDGDGLIDCEDDDCYLNNSDECISCLGSSQTFADVVLSYNPVCPEQHDPIVTNPQNAIGSPNYELPGPGENFGSGFVSLGEGGSIELGFVDNILVNSGDSESDLYVFEVGTDIESMMVDLRPINSTTIDILIANGFSDSDLDGYFEISTIAGATSSLDLDALIPGQSFGILKFDAVILTDVINNAGCIGSSGADVDAICALTSMPAEICDNDIDDDGDGLVDCDDPDLAEDCCCITTQTLDIGEDQVICPGESVTINAEGEFISYLWSDGTSESSLTITDEGTYSVEVIDLCDNVISDMITITFGDPTVITEELELCDGESVVLYGETYNSEGIYEVTLAGNNACDTSLTITIVAAEPISITEMFEICAGESIEVYGEIYNSGGTFESTLPGNNACDTSLTITILIAEPVSITEMFEICEGESIELYGETYDSEGSYESTLPGNNSCDTTLIITINAGQIYESTQSYTINSGDSLELNNEVYYDSGVYTQNLSTVAGCDSLINVIVSVNLDIVHYDFENCLSNNEGENTIYTEFTASYPDPLNCGTVQATNIYRDNPTVNGHSCTEGVNESIAMCVSSQVSCEYESASELSVKFEIDISVDEGSIVELNQLSFYEKSPEIFSWIDGGSGPNYFPTLYGIRILLDGQLIYNQESINTTSDWSLAEFNLSELSSARITSNSEMAIELTAYCTDGFVSNVTAWDIDEINLSATCSPITSSRTIAGIINTPNGDVIQNIRVTRKKIENSTYQNVDTNGQYAFDSDIDTDYTISASKDDQRMKGVSTKDLILIQNHILGFSQFEHAYQYIAADLNNSNHISSIDVVVLRKLILGVTEEYPNNTSWTFVEPSEADNPPWTISEQLNVSKGSNNSIENNLIALKIGDVSEVTNSTTSDELLDTRSDKSIHIEAIPSNHQKAFNLYSELDFYTQDMENIYGFQLSIDLNGIVIEELTSKLIDISEKNYHFANDQLVISWSDINPLSTSTEPLFTIAGKISANQLSSIALSQSSFNSEVYVGKELKEKKIELSARTNSDYLSSLSATLYPNPMTNASQLIIDSKSDDMATIKIIDVSGRLISQKHISLTKGSNSIIYERVHFGKSGLYCILINQGTEQIMYKLIVN